MASDTNQLLIKEVRNPKIQISDTDAAAFRRLRERRVTRIAKEHALQQAARPTVDIRALQKATKDGLTRVMGGDFETIAKQIREEFKPRFDEVRPDIMALEIIDLDLDYDYADELNPAIPPPPPPPEGIGEFWWAQTAFIGNLGGLTVDLPDEFIHIFGHVHYGGDPLLTGSVGAIEDFVLSPARFPTTTKTKFDIPIELRIKGILSGWTGTYHGLWAADDKWCKCWQIMRRTVFLSTGQILSNQVLALPMINLENVSPVGQANPDLTGGYGALPQFDVNLAALAASGIAILLQIETRFDIQLEGDADIWFRRFGGSASQSVPSMQNAVLLQSKPMSLHVL